MSPVHHYNFSYQNLVFLGSSINHRGSSKLYLRDPNVHAARRRATALQELPRSDNLFVEIRFVAMIVFYSGGSASPAANLHFEEHNSGWWLGSTLDGFVQVR